MLEFSLDFVRGFGLVMSINHANPYSTSVGLL